MNVAIVGGGPAGSALALRLARAGIGVTLIDRAEWPRAKPCGDCLSAEAAILLDRLGLLDRVHGARPALLTGWRIVAPAGHAFSARFDELGTGDPRVERALALPRHTFDALMLDAARDAGAGIRTRTAVTDITPGPQPSLRFRGPEGTGTLRADLIVGADGLRSIVARRLGLVARRARVSKVSLTAHIRGATLPDDMGEMHVAGGVCAGLAPVGSDLFNLTLVADASRHGRTIADDMPGFFTAALDRFPILPARLRNAELPRDAGEILASGPFDMPVRTVAGPGWALAGDAAGYFDPFTGQGIARALRDADLLAAAILDIAAGRSPVRSALDAYAAAHRRQVRPARALQRLIDRVLCHPALADRAIARLARAPAAARTLLAVTGDLRPARALLSPAVLLSMALSHSRRSRS